MIQSLDALILAAAAAPIVPVLVVDRIDDAAPLAAALSDGGITIAEVTLRTPDALDVLKEMKRAGTGLLVGMGTVLSAEDARRSVDAGADFLVSPGMTPALLAGLGGAKALMIPGIATASEAMAASEAGFSLLKLFPATVAGGVAALKAFAGPLPDLRFMPTGGVTEANAADFVALPNVVAAGGSWIATPIDLAAGDWAAISTKAAHVLDGIRRSKRI